MASLITVKRNDGVTEEFSHYKGLTTPMLMTKALPDGGHAEHIEAVRAMEIRDDDVYLATYPKCGTHWMWEIIQMLRRGNSEYERDAKEVTFLDMLSVKSIDDQPSPRVLNCHYPLNLIPKQILEKGTKIVHVQRNPKDMAVSFYNHLHSLLKKKGQTPPTFQMILSNIIGQNGIYLFSPWFKYVKDWERFQKKHPEQVITISFEDMKEDPVREIRKVNSFLGYDKSEMVMATIAEACSFKNLKKADADIKKQHTPENVKTSGDNFMYRKGEVGDWKNWFTVAQNEMMDAWLEENLVDTDLKFRYEL